MLVLITYDVATSDDGGTRRLRRVARVCSDFGIRVQKSVFECQVGAKEWVVLKNRLIDEIDEKMDSLRFYFIDQKSMQKTEHYGVNQPVNLQEPFVI